MKLVNPWSEWRRRRKSTEKRRRLKNLIDSLPSADRQLLLRLYFEEWSLERTAAEMQVSKQQIALNRYRLLLHLGSQMKERRETGFVALWALMGVMFTKRTRERFWDPVIGEDLEDFLALSSQRSDLWWITWLRACFLFRTMLRLVQVLWHIGLARLIYACTALYLAMKATK